MTSAPPFTPEQFSTRPGIAQVETNLQRWLKELPVEERMDFIARLWPINYPLALILMQSSQLPARQIEVLLRLWLAEGRHNTAQKLIQYFVVTMGEKKFWKVVVDVELLPAMRDFINYHSRGRLDELQRG